MLDLNFAFSRRLALVLAMLHVAALLGTFGVALPLDLKTILVCLLLTSCAVHCANHAARSLPWSVVAAKIENTGGIALQLRNGQQVEGTILEGSFVAPWLTILRYRRHGAWWPRSLIILPDMLPADTFRQMRVWLKWRRPQPQPLF